jgi:hypothetical protein
MSGMLAGLGWQTLLPDAELVPWEAQMAHFASARRRPHAGVASSFRSERPRQDEVPSAAQP